MPCSLTFAGLFEPSFHSLAEGLTKGHQFGNSVVSRPEGPGLPLFGTEVHVLSNEFFFYRSTPSIPKRYRVMREDDRGFRELRMNGIPETA